MRQYKEMIENVRSLGLFRYDREKSSLATPEELRTFWERIEASKVFVFDVTGWDFPDNPKGPMDSVLDLPFETCFFENLGTVNEKPEVLIGFGDGSKTGVSCMLIHELGPGHYDSYTMLDMKKGKKVILTTPKTDWNQPAMETGNLMAWFSQIWIDRLNKSVFGVERVRERIKIGTGSDKRVHTIRQLIRVVPKSQRAHAMPRFSREIDWSHRWTVRGHWRKHDGLGKNRGGEYCVQGSTWVMEHERGPEDMPIINKTRFVSSPSFQVSEKE